MKRATGLLAIISACAVSALAFAQSQETPPEEATAAAAQPAEQDAPPAADYVEPRRARPITGKDRKSTRLNSSHQCASRMPTSACKHNPPYPNKIKLNQDAANGTPPTP